MGTKKKGTGCLVLIVCACIAVPLYRCSHRGKEPSREIPSVTTEAQTVTTAAQTTTTAPETTTTTTTTTAAETTTAPETTTKKKKTKPKTTKPPETTVTKAPEPDPKEIQNAVQNGDYSLVTPEFKATMDAYEAFYDEYLAFMKKYTSGEGDMLAMMNDYMTMMSKMEEWSNRIDAIDTNKLTPADDAYYLLVTLRIEKKLIGGTL